MYNLLAQLAVRTYHFADCLTCVALFGDASKWPCWAAVFAVGLELAMLVSAAELS